MKIQILFLTLFLSLAPTPEQILDQGIKHYKKGEYSEASDLLSKIGDSSSVKGEAHFWTGKCYLKTGEWGKAVKAMEKAVWSAPSNAIYHLWLGRAYGENADHRLWPPGKYSDAKKCREQFEKAAKLSPENIDIRFDLIEFYTQAPGRLGGGKDKAWREAELISKLQPLRGYVARAIIHENEEKWDLAKKELVQATIEFPDEADTHKDLAQFLFDRKDYAGALAAAEKALELNGLSKGTRIIIAASRVELGTSLGEAEKGLLEMVSGPLGDEDPSFDEVYYWLGVCYFKKGEKDKARDAFRSVLKYMPKHEKAKKYLDRIH